MSIEALTAVNAGAAAGAFSSASAAGAAGSPFGLVLDQIAALDTQMKLNDRSIQAIALGDSVNLHEVMMDLERTRLTFDLMLQVRNKFMDAYQELMRMQV